MKHEDITERVIGAFYAVYNTLGWGFLEKVYQGAMKIELERRGLSIVPQAKMEVFYGGVAVGEYFADFLVEGCVIVELKSAERIAKEHEAQVINYLRASAVDVGLLLNFGPSAEFRRKVVERDRGPGFTAVVFHPD
ncbi:MAG: GxxExxY protein [Isosphaera sp.]|nr:GxxExxY protein [Isosphaera sp.]